MKNAYTHTVEQATFLGMNGIVHKPVAVILYNDKPVHRSNPYASSRGADVGGRKIAARYQSYLDRTGRRWEVEQDEIRQRRAADHKAKREAAERVRAAAPDLLALLEMINEAAQGHIPLNNHWVASVTAAAIAKARGE